MAVLLASPFFIVSYKTVWFFNRDKKIDHEKYILTKPDSICGSIRNFLKVQDLVCWPILRDIECMEPLKWNQLKLA